MNAVGTDRWHTAQAAEQRYWDGLRSDARECARILVEKQRTAAWIEQRLPELPAGDRVEIGIGPLGMGVAHFLGDAEGRRVVGVEPLPLIPVEELVLPRPFVAAVAACRSGGYEHVRAAGEETGLPGGSFGLAISYNMLDHVRDAGAVLREAARLLRPDGRLVLGVDTISTLSRLRFELWVRRRHPGTVGVEAHTFRWRSGELAQLVRDSGFRIATAEGLEGGLASLVGRSRRVLLIAEKRAAGY